MNMSVVVAAFITGFFLGYLVRAVISLRRRERARQSASWTGMSEWAVPIAETSHKANRATAQPPIAETSHKANRSTAQAPIAQTSHKVNTATAQGATAQAPIAETSHKANRATARAPTATQIRSLWTYRDAPPMKDHTPPTAP
jgi:hypothetical protein